MSQVSEIFLKNIRSTVDQMSALLADENFHSKFLQLTDWIVTSFQQGGRLYIAGNGGSAADAQHLAAELVGKLDKPRRAFPAEALTVDTSALTAIGNDFGFDFVFSRHLEAKATPKDVFLGITTSGNSPNILEAFKTCQKIGCKSVLLSSRDGGKAHSLAEMSLLVPGTVTSQIQQSHQVVYHSLCEAIEVVMLATPKF